MQPMKSKVITMTWAVWVIFETKAFYYWNKSYCCEVGSKGMYTHDRNVTARAGNYGCGCASTTWNWTRQAAEPIDDKLCRYGRSPLWTANRTIMQAV